MASLLVIQSRYSEITRVVAGELLVSYTTKGMLGSPLCYARLVSLTGLESECFVFTDFTKPQIVNNKLEPYLGSNRVENTLIPIASVPPTGHLTLRLADGTVFRPPPYNVVIIVEFSHGAQDQVDNGSKDSTPMS